MGDFQMKQELENDMYVKEGQMGGAVGNIIVLITGVGVSVLVLIFVGVLGGQTYQQVEADIDAISNGTIKASVKNGVISGFEALEDTGSYLPIIVLAVIITVVLALVLGMTLITQGGTQGGRVL